MRFALPVALFALLAAPLLVLVYVASERRRRRAAAAFANPVLVPVIAPERPGIRRHVPATLLLLTFVALTVAAARPQAVLSVPRERATVMLALDASRSMNATDMPPSRLATARSAIDRILDVLPERFRVGAVAFGKSARVLSAPTLDRQVVTDALVSVETSTGTLLGDGLMEAVASLRRDWREGGRAPAVILLLSDGNDTGSEIPPLEAAATAREAGVPVHVVSIGDPSSPTDVRPLPPNVELLRGIAEGAGGRFFAAPTDDALLRVGDELGSRVGTRREVTEISVAFVGVGMMLAAAAAIAAVRIFRRI
ncbi:MAG TPA: VWA domain-containing protein [Actinomycetota bacterium]|nr:VWA domain-containing protein [Actinomycetota bacterium]